MPNRDTWIFDLDHTLYPPKAQLFDQIEVRMRQFMATDLQISAAEADRLRAQYWQHYGTTLKGLMTEHAIDPDPFLEAVHDIDFTVLSPDPSLIEQIKALPGRKLVYTNGTKTYAQKVIAQLGLQDHLQDIYGIQEADYHPKPQPEAFEAICHKARINPKRAIMFEDVSRNLIVPHQMGMTTVLVGTAEPAPHIHHQTQELCAFLAAHNKGKLQL